MDINNTKQPKAKLGKFWLWLGLVVIIGLGVLIIYVNH